MEKFNLPKGQTRHVDVREVTIDEENQTLEFSFSSEEPYERYWGIEIISHDKGAMDLERLNSAAPLLFNHDWDKQIGVVEKAWVGDDKRGYVKVKFSKSAFAQEKYQDIKDGILKGVSFGYEITDVALEKKGDANKSEPNQYRVKTFPFEVSCVTVPADYKVGIDRSFRAAGIEGEIEVTIPADPEPEPIPEPINKPADTNAAPPKEKKMDEIQVKAEGAKAERERAAAINALGTKFNKTDLAKSLVENGTSLEDAKGAFLEAVGARQVSVGEGDLGLSEKEIKQFSFVKAINAMANPGNKEAFEAAGFEREVSKTAQDKYKKAAKGFMIPTEILMAKFRRDLVVGTTTAGGHTVATDLKSESFIDMLRAKLVLDSMGVTTLNGLVGNLAIPRQTGGATAYWVAESGNPTESQQAFDQVAMSPKTLGAFTDFSRKLTLQSSLDVEAFVRGDLAKTMALELSRSALYGSGASNQPTGVKNVSGINVVDFAATNPTWGEVVDMETAIAADNADIGNMKYLINATSRGYFKKTEKVSGYPMFIMGEDGKLNGYDAPVSNQVVAGDVWFGNWSDLIMGLWSGLDLLVDPYTGGIAGTVRVIVHQDVDFAVRHPESFALGYAVP